VIRESLGAMQLGGGTAVSCSKRRKEDGKKKGDYR